MKLNERKQKILIGVIEEYILDASPITSSSVQEKVLSDISTATLRNELNALESMGYLKQLHTSSGRIPTAEGYKYYVSSLLEDFKVSKSGLTKVKSAIGEETKSLTQVLSCITELISNETKYPTVLVANGYDKLLIEEVKIIPLIDSELLVLFRTKSGIVKNSIFVSATEKVCDDASRYLSKKFFGKTIGEMLNGELLKQSLQEVESFKNLVECLIDSMRNFVEQNKISIKGSAINLLDENVKSSVVKTKKIMTLLGDKEALENTIQTHGEDICVEIGDENKGVEGCALITAPIVIKGCEVASIAVIGPDRMNYAEIASALKLVMSELNRN